MGNKREGYTNNYINRELSWLEFNERVLEEAYDTNNPLFERLKFASIVSSNLDEFFMVRVASIYDQVMAAFDKPDPSGLTPKQQIDAISARTHEMIVDQYNCVNRSLIPTLKKEKIFFLKESDFSEAQREFIDSYYAKMIYPVLTPMVVDQSRPFPLLLNKSLNIALLLEEKEGSQNSIFATVQVPSVLSRFMEVPSEDDKRCFVLLEEIIRMNIDTLFNGHDVLSMGYYRITRNSDQGLDEEGAEDLLEAIEQFIKMRKWGTVIRLEISSGMEPQLLNILRDELEVPKGGIYEISGAIDLTFLMKLSSLKGFDALRYKQLVPLPSPGFMDSENIFDAVSRGDIILHHPYESFDPVVELVRQAANDPDVLAIKQTLYRVSGKSPIVEALAQAAENGKQVTVLVELKARFDEQNNIIWAKRLEMSGCHVIYGLVGLKTHCKLLLIVRREDDEIKRYVHLSTGNYNDDTAKFYTDLGLFTVNPYFGADASAIFNMLSGYSHLTKMFKIDIAPIGLRSRFLNLIKNEMKNAKNGKKSRIVVKINSLIDEQIISTLYEASNAGVEIDLIVRGMCCLQPGIKGLSERICVRSIVGRFLEHSRIFYFYNDGDELIYLSSADWMGRNLDRRVEVLFPVEDFDARKKVKGILDLCLRDTVKSRILNSSGTYTRVDKRGKENLDSQVYSHKQVDLMANEGQNEDAIKEFRPIMSY